MALTEEQKRHQEELKANRDKADKRKRRTRRLIEHGAVAESFVSGSEDMTGEEFKQALAQKISPTGRRDYPDTDRAEKNAQTKKKLEKLSW
jgi:hypothetical protein